VEAGASFHQDPEHMTRSPRAGAVRDAGDYGSGWIAFAGALVLWVVTAHGDEFDD
jgi:hypothetical protein